MKRIIFAFAIIHIIAFTAQASIKQRIKLQVPIVTQAKMLCGPATIEMLFRYWGVDNYDQYDIAKALLDQFSTSSRYKNSGILETDPIDWNKYPGTGTINMREFLKRFGKTYNMVMEYEPDSDELKKHKRDECFYKVKHYLSKGIPVVVHQYWKLPKSRGHYRIVTGYDEKRREVYLNDANGGKQIVQSYDDFLNLWNVDQRWLHYNAIIFNINKHRLDVDFR